MNLSSRFAISESNLTSVLSNWTMAEHARLHGSGDSVMTDLEAMRTASAKPYTDPSNTPIKKTQQHMDRLRQRLDYLEEAEFEDEITARSVSDCFKLFSGQQVKRYVAQADDQEDFELLVRSGATEVGFTIESVWGSFEGPSTQLGTLSEEVRLLRSNLDRSLETIAIRAGAGRDWGVQGSTMAEAAWLGEVACARLAIVTIGYIALHNGGIDKVPLRAAASDAEDAPITYPFTWEG